MAYPDKTCDVPQVAPGSVLHLAADDWLYGRGADPGHPVDLVIEQVRDDLAHLSGGRDIWVEGHAVDCGRGHPPCCQLLVHLRALRKARLFKAG